MVRKLLIVLMWLVLVCTACGEPPSAATTAEEDVAVEDVAVAAIPLLAPPRNTRLADLPPEAQTPLTDSMVLDMTCQDVAKWAGIPLLHLEEAPAGVERVVCGVSSGPDAVLPVHEQTTLPEEERTGWGLHVLYVPDSVDLGSTSYLQFLEGGGVDVARYVYGPHPAPAPRAEDPDEVAGGYAPFDRNGSPAGIQRRSERRYTASWSGSTLPGHTRNFIGGAIGPDRLIAAARQAREGNPPGATVAAEARRR